ncbi:MAG: SelB C-terminal domain-containing protein, partial [Candidatus Eremiobacteraeota bacterium]|nr:SelB C-terminal domain-containing protein [Candidatus Eremiobacteraeota bacterium]
EAVVPFDRSTPFVPADLETVVETMRRSRVAGLSQAFDTLVARGVLVKVNDFIYRGTQIRMAQERLQGFFTSERLMTMAQFRDLLGTSRKYAVPLLEWFDARGVTVRSGDHRALRKPRDPAEASVSAARIQ